MLSSKYDSNKDGIVNKADIATTAESVEWNAVKNKPDVITGDEFMDLESQLTNALQEKLGKTDYFDALAGLKFTKTVTTFLGASRIEEAIYSTGNNRKLATRETQFLANGNIWTNIKIYKPDGTNVLKESITTTTFKNNGEIEEVVS